MPVVTVSFGAPDSDTRRRPLVIAPVAAEGHDSVAFLASVKEAVGHGADLVVVPETFLTDGTPTDGTPTDTHRSNGNRPGEVAGVVVAAGAGIVGEATDQAGFARLADRGITCIWWRGPGPVPGRGTDEGDVRVPVLSRDVRGLRPGDALLVPADDPAAAGPTPPGVVVIVDLMDVADRALAAAAVTVALEHGAVGFLTVLPGAVRRAAHVIRAVEHAE